MRFYYNPRLMQTLAEAYLLTVEMPEGLETVDSFDTHETLLRTQLAKLIKEAIEDDQEDVAELVKIYLNIDCWGLTNEETSDAILSSDKYATVLGPLFERWSAENTQSLLPEEQHLSKYDETLLKSTEASLYEEDEQYCIRTWQQELTLRAVLEQLANLN